MTGAGRTGNLVPKRSRRDFGVKRVFRPFGGGAALVLCQAEPADQGRHPAILPGRQLRGRDDRGRAAGSAAGFHHRDRPSRVQGFRPLSAARRHGAVPRRVRGVAVPPVQHPGGRDQPGHAGAAAQRFARGPVLRAVPAGAREQERRQAGRADPQPVLLGLSRRRRSRPGPRPITCRRGGRPGSFRISTTCPSRCSGARSPRISARRPTRKAPAPRKTIGARCSSSPSATTSRCSRTSATAKSTTRSRRSARPTSATGCAAISIACCRSTRCRSVRARPACGRGSWWDRRR